LAGWQANAVSEALRVTATDLPKTTDSPKGDTKAKPASPTTADPVAAPANSNVAAANGAKLPPAGGTPARSAPASNNDKPGEGVAMTPAAGGVPKSSAGDVSPKPAMDRGVPDDYEIGAGDVLHIAVFHEPDASVQGVQVRPDGKISMPLLKEVSVVGLTPTQLEKQITEQLTKFLTAPDVTIIVSAINSKKIYLIGAVKKEGPIAYTYRMSVMQALSEAGGLTDYAKRKKIYVLRTIKGQEFRFPFDYDAVLRGEHMELNIPLMAGDTLVVPH
jgi:polysaccharide biosynthesis/export protein